MPFERRGRVNYLGQEMLHRTHAKQGVKQVVYGSKSRPPARR